MAENKKSFIAYSDWNGMFKALPDDLAGKLIKHIFSYVNDENPTTDDFMVNALFEQIKSTLKRDLIKWEEQKEQRSEAGKKSAAARATKINDRSIPFNEKVRNQTVSVSVNENVNENVIVNEKIIEYTPTAKFSFFQSLINLGVEKDLVNDWLAVRKTKKATNTKTAFNNLLIEFEKSGKPINEIIKKCAVENWSGFKSSWQWQNNNLNNNQNGKQINGFTSPKKQAYVFDVDRIIEANAGKN